MPQTLPIGQPGIGEHCADPIPNFPQQEDAIFLTTIAYPRMNDQGLMEACPTVVAVGNIEGRILVVTGIQSESKLVQGHPANREVGIDVQSELNFEKLKSLLSDVVGDNRFVVGWNLPY